MKNNYLHIIDRLGAPLFFDEYGVPIYELPDYIKYTQNSDQLLSFMKTLGRLQCDGCGEYFVCKIGSSDVPPYHITASNNVCGGVTITITKEPISFNEFKRIINKSTIMEQSTTVLKLYNRYYNMV